MARATGQPRVCGFQSTHPVRGATGAAGGAGHLEIISIHAPRAGCDASSFTVIPVCAVFQSTHPVRGATDKRYGLEAGA